MDIFYERPSTVIKLGGSLFDLPDLSERILKFLDQNNFKNPLIVPGGGRFADVVRDLGQQHNIGNILSHQLGIRTLSLSAHFVAGLSERFKLTTCHEKLSEFDCYPVVDVSNFVLNHCPLPNSWDVTSDSIVAWLASRNPESHLILLKSISIPLQTSPSKAVELQYVDVEFPDSIKSLKQISWLNLRATHPKLVKWVDQ